MHIFVAGGTGFLGRQIVRELLANGHRISLLIHHNLPEEFQSKCDIYHGNITSFSWSDLEADLPDVIIHLARIPGRFLPGRLSGGIRGWYANHRLLSWMKNRETPPVLLYTSGTLVYGSKDDLPVDETFPIQPISFQKYYSLAEHPILNELNGSLPVRIIRPPWVFGAGSWFTSFYYKPMQEEGYVPVYGTGNQFVTLIALEEFARIVGCISEAGTGNDIYNTVSNQPVRQHQFARLLSEISGLPERRITESQLRRKYGSTVTEALTHSLYVQTKHEYLYSTAPNTLPKLRQQLREVIDRLKTI